MSATRYKRRAVITPRQRGVALVVLLVLLGVAVGAALLSVLSTERTLLASERKTDAALARAKAALIGYSISNPARPGAFTCPDTRAPTDPNYGLEGACAAGGLIGRVPWRTLGIPEPVDASGETLWYAVSAFARLSGSAITAIRAAT